MPKEKREKLLCVEDLRHAEYYGMQKVFDELYVKSVENPESTCQDARRKHGVPHQGDSARRHNLSPVSEYRTTTALLQAST